MEKGYIHVYTGNGKGKTTAAFGVALRTALIGKNVFIGQFIKGMKYSETAISQYLENIEIQQLGEHCFIDKEPTPKDLEMAQEGLTLLKERLNSGRYDLVIFDELTIAFYYKLLEVDAVLELLRNKPEHVEVIITGRYCPDSIIEIADLVTEMKEIKHYYKQGVLSRAGIDC